MSTNTITEIIKNRRATPPRLLAKKEISKEVIEQLLENANWAPNHKNTEPWRFKVLTGENKKRLAQDFRTLLQAEREKGYPVAPEKIEKFSSTIERVPVAIGIVLQRDPGNHLPEWEEIAAVAMAVQNMWLTATEMGLGAFWATPTFTELFDELLGIQEGQKFLGFFYVGETMVDSTSPGRGDVANKVEWM